jgi:hypothetical protein
LRSCDLLQYPALDHGYTTKQRRRWEEEEVVERGKSIQGSLDGLIVGLGTTMGMEPLVVNVEAIHSSSAGVRDAPQAFQPGKEPLLFHTWPVRTALPRSPWCEYARRSTIAQSYSHKEQTALTPQRSSPTPKR